MANPCSICGHPKRKAIDRAIISGITIAEVATKFGVHRDAIARHRARHLIGAIERAAEARVARTDAAAIETTTDIEKLARGLLAKAAGLVDEPEARLGERAAMMREARSMLELLARILGRLSPAGATAMVVMQHPAAATAIEPEEPPWVRRPLVVANGNEGG